MNILLVSVYTHPRIMNTSVYRRLVLGNIGGKINALRVSKFS